MTSQKSVLEEQKYPWQDYYRLEPNDSYEMFAGVEDVLKKIRVDRQSFATYDECIIDAQEFFEGCEEMFVPEPLRWIQAISCVLHKIFEKRVVVRIINISESKNLNSHDIDKYVCVVGSITQIGQPKLRLRKACYKCTNCDSFQLALIGDHYRTCSECKCPTALDRNRSELLLFQRLRVSDQANINIEIEITDNLVGCFIAGDQVKVHGILCTQKDEQKPCLFVKYIQAYHMLIHDALEEEQFTRQEERQFAQIKDELFGALIKNFCPSIYGHEIVKAGLLLSIVGGGCNRDACHSLVVGDPGQGKSQLIKFANQVSPKSLIVSGTGVSQSGLLCTILKKDDDVMIDAGALVLCDEGVCCLDEFDKMTNHTALLEVMEQQTVTVAKSAVMCQFHARTTIIATANPSSGHFQRHKSLFDNLKIHTTVLARFDLIFLLIDSPDPTRDQKLTDHIMQLHNHKRPKTAFSQDLHTPMRYQCLNDRIAQQANCDHEISIPFMKKILAFLRKQSPEMTQGANEKIKDYYLRIRQQTLSIPVTTRNLQSLIRLSQAKAKLSMHELVEEADAQFAIDLFEETRFDCYIQQGTGTHALRQNNNIGNLSRPKQTAILLDHLHDLALKKESFLFTMEELKVEGKKINLQVGDLLDFVEVLNSQSLLIQKGQGIYELNFKR